MEHLPFTPLYTLPRNEKSNLSDSTDDRAVARYFLDRFLHFSPHERRGSITTSPLAKFLTSFFLARKDLAKNQCMLKLLANNAAAAAVAAYFSCSGG